MGKDVAKAMQVHFSGTVDSDAIRSAMDGSGLRYGSTRVRVLQRRGAIG